MNACNRESEATPLARALRSPWQPPQFIPIRFIFTNKLSRDGKLLLAFDSSVLSEAMGREIGFTKNRPRRRSQHNKSKDIALSRVVRKRMERIAVLLCKLAPPDLGCEAEFGGSEKLWPPG
jgi:hypothetical protein